MAAELVDVVVIGAGQAGLSAAYHLHRLGLTSSEQLVVLDAGRRPGGAWQHRWPSLKLGAAHGIHSLPGLDLDPTDDDLPAAQVVGRYFDDYEQRFGLAVRRPVQVTAVSRADGRLLVQADTAWSARAVVNATGTWTAPFIPHYPGIETFAGRQLHTAGYRSAEEFAGQRVLVVGGGTSAVQLLIEISSVAQTYWVTRRPPVWRAGPFDQEAGREAVALVEQAVRAGRPPASVVSVTGLMVTPAVSQAQADGVLARRPMFESITPSGVRWADGTELAVDVILWCTGFRAALDHLAPLHLREPGGGVVMNGTQVAREPRVHLVGYGPSASTIGANRAGRAAAQSIVKSLAG